MLEKEIRPHRLPRRLISSIRASSTLQPTAKASYAVENLLDGRGDTAWIEGREGMGVGEWIEISFKTGAKIHGIGILNGYRKSAAVFGENGCVRGVAVRTTPFMDWYDESVDLPAPESPSVGKDWPIAGLQWIFEAGEGAVELRKIRITITKAEAGSRFADTAISELFIYGNAKSP